MAAWFAAVACGLVLAKSSLVISSKTLWELISFMVLPGSLYGWLIAGYASVKIAPDGILVTNPYNKAFVPWCAIERIDDDGVMSLLRITTVNWSITSWTIGVAGWEHYFDRPNRVQRVAAALMEYQQSIEPCEDRQMCVAWLKWRLPLWVVMGYVVAWFILTLLVWL